MTNKPERVEAILNQNSLLKSLTHRAKQLCQLDLILQQVIPVQFINHCSLANITSTHIIVHTDNANLASLLRFHAPIICSKLSEHLPQAIHKLDVKVRPSQFIQITEISSPTPLSVNAAKSIFQTAESLDDGALKKSLEKLADRLKKT